MELLEVKHISKIYPIGDVPTHALSDVSLKVHAGEILVILGPSGSGKTTLLNILSGLDNPTKGSILFQGEDLTNYSERKLTQFRKQHLGFIFQTYNLLEHLNVYENVLVGKNLSKQDVDVDQILEVVGLSKHRKKYMYQLSGGEQQRVSIARTMAKQPEILFGDEPTGALDEVTGKKILKELVKINELYHTTMILITHNPGIALIGDRVVRMNSGKIASIQENPTRIDPNDISWG